MPRAKMITLYHGTNSRTLTKIRKSKVVLGYWDTNTRLPMIYSVTPLVGEPVSKFGYPVMIVAKVPEAIIVWEEEGYVAEGFLLPDGHVESKSYVQGVGNYMSGRLPIRFVIQVLHYKPRGKSGYNIEDINDSFMFVKSQWRSTKR